MDALLAAFARHLGVSPEAARPALYALLDRLREGLDGGGPVALDGVGTWTEGGARFEPDAQLLAAVNRAYAGLAPVSDAPAAAPAAPLPAAPAPAAPAVEPVSPGGIPLVVPSPVRPVVGGAAPAEPFATPFRPGEGALDPYDEVPEGTPVAAPLDAFDVPVGRDPFAEDAPNAPASEGPEKGEPEADEADAELDALIAGVWAAPSPPSPLEPPPPYEEAPPYEPAAPDETPEPPAPAPPAVAAFVSASSLTQPSQTPPAVAAVRDDERPPEPPPRRRSALVFLLPLAFLALVALAYALWQRGRGDRERTANVPAEPAPPVALAVPDTAAADRLLPADTVAGDVAVADGGLPAEPPPVAAEPAPARPAPAPPARTEAPAPRPAAPRPTAPAPRPEPPATPPERPAYTPAPATPEATAAPPGASPFAGGGAVDPAAGGVTWIVNSTTSANARMQAERYRAQGLRAGVLSAVVGGRTVWRVALGQFASVAEAEAARSRLPADARADAWILRLGG